MNYLFKSTNMLKSLKNEKYKIIIKFKKKLIVNNLHINHYIKYPP